MMRPWSYYSQALAANTANRIVVIPVVVVNIAIGAVEFPRVGAVI
jgi:hypothetical protein